MRGDESLHSTTITFIELLAPHQNICGYYLRRDVNIQRWRDVRCLPKVTRFILIMMYLLDWSLFTRIDSRDLTALLLANLISYRWALCINNFHLTCRFYLRALLLANPYKRVRWVGDSKALEGYLKLVFNIFFVLLLGAKLEPLTPHAQVI